MASWNAVYVRALPAVDVTPWFASSAQVRTWSGWTEVSFVSIGEDGTQLALELSKTSAEPVIWCLIQTAASVLSIVHCEAGQVVRRLSFADGSWREVEGTPQRWEAQLFDPAVLEEALEQVEDEAEAQALRSQFAAKTFSVGSQQPWPREFEAMFAVLGVSLKQWQAASAQAATQHLVGRKPKRITWVVRGLLSLSVVLLGALPFLNGDARGVGAALGFPLLALAAGAMVLRKLEVGRWLR